MLDVKIIFRRYYQISERKSWPKFREVSLTVDGINHFFTLLSNQWLKLLKGVEEVVL